MPKLPPWMRRVGARLYWYGTRDGERVSIPLGADYQRALVLYADIEGRRDPAPGTVAQAIELYRERALPRLASSTRYQYGYTLTTLRKVFGHMPLDGVRKMHLAAFLDGHRAPVSANRAVSTLRSVYEFAGRVGLTDYELPRLHRNRERARSRYVTADEFRRLREAADPHIAAAIDLAYLTAVRRGDMLALPVSAGSDGVLAWRQGKTGREVRFRVSGTLEVALWRLRASRGAQVRRTLVAKRNGRPYTGQGFGSVWDRLRARAGLADIHWHDIRGTALADARDRGGIDYAQAVAGHDHRATTEGYTAGRRTQIVQPLD